MLGTNDLKTHFNLTPQQIAKGASTLVGDVFRMGISRDHERPKVLLIAPAIVYDKPDWAFSGAAAKSKSCAPIYADEAEAHGCEFLDANDFIRIPDPATRGGDGIHLSADNCLKLGQAVADKVRDIFNDRT